MAVGCPVLNLQKRLQALETPYDNQTLVPEHLLQAQLIRVRTRQEHLLRLVDNFTRIPGWPLPPGLGLPREDGKGGASRGQTKRPLDLNPVLWPRMSVEAKTGGEGRVGRA